MHDHAAWAERRKAWAIKAEADESMRRAAKACRRAAKAPDRMDASAAWRVSTRVERAAKALNRAASAFRRSSRLSEAAGVDMMRACRAHKRAADMAHAVAAAKRATRSYGRALDAIRLSNSALEWTKALTGNAVKLAAGSTKLAKCDAGQSEAGGVRDGIRSALSSAQDDLRGASDWARALSEASAEDVDRSERRAAKARRLAADASERSAAKAVAVAGRGRNDPGVKRVAASWNKAGAAANMADGRREATKAAEVERRRAGKAARGRLGGDTCGSTHDSA